MRGGALEEEESMNAGLISWLPSKETKRDDLYWRCSLDSWKDCCFFFVFLSSSSSAGGAGGNFWRYWKMNSSVPGTGAVTDINELSLSLSLSLSLFSSVLLHFIFCFENCVYRIRFVLIGRGHQSAASWLFISRTVTITIFIWF